MKQLSAPRMDKCNGCLLCALACSRINYKKFGWSSAGIRIQSSPMGVVEGYSAHFCIACENPPCAQVCPTEALVPRGTHGGVSFHVEKCVSCGKCIEICPVEAIHRDAQGQIYLCIHCGKCVSYCPQNCLAWEDESCG